MSCKTTVYTVKGSDDRLWGVFSSEEMACRYIRQEWPEAEDEIKALTDAFLEARYSADDISAGEAGLIKRTWQQVRSGIRKRRHGPD